MSVVAGGINQRRREKSPVKALKTFFSQNLIKSLVAISAIVLGAH